MAANIENILISVKIMFVTLILCCNFCGKLMPFITFLQQGEPLCCHDDSVVDLDPCLGKFGDCLLFKKLIDLANPLHFQVVLLLHLCDN